MRRREVVAGLTLIAASGAHAQQQGERRRRIGVLMNVAADDPEGQARIAKFRQELQRLGWTDGPDVQIDVARQLTDAERAVLQLTMNEVRPEPAEHG